MLDWTDRHCRYFHRQLTRHARLYTEMITANAILHGNRSQLLDHAPEEAPVALQLGGSDPAALAQAAAIGQAFGYNEINLNVGCPSDRVQSGRFGACLMAEPALVAHSVRAMKDAVKIPVTVKCRIGIDDQDSERDLETFIATVRDGGCEIFIIHARKAWLSGLSPKQNRDVPPLNYDRVYRLKAKHPDLGIIINGGIATLEDAQAHLAHVDGVMLGRAAYRFPYILADVDGLFYGSDGARVTRAEAGLAMRQYYDGLRETGLRVGAITRHMMGLYHGQPRGKFYRRFLSENAIRRDLDPNVIDEALQLVEDGRNADVARAMEVL